MKNVAPKAKTTKDVIGRVLPLILIMLVVLGGFYPAINMTAGEKEHGTLPTLLCAPINHLELLLGKYVAILLIALLGVSVNILSISSIVFFGLADLPLNLSPTIMLYIFVALVPTAMLYTALFMGVAIYANTYREAQNLLSPVTLIAILPAYSALLPGVKLNVLTAITPGFNIALLIKEVLIKPVNPELIFLTLVANLAWTLAILVVTARTFAAEQVLLGGASGFGEIFTLDRNALPRPNPQLSTVLFLVFLTGTFYLSGALLRHGILVLIPILQLGLFLGLPLMISIYYRMNIASVFRLRLPGLMPVAGAILLGSTLFVSTKWISGLTPPPPEYEKLLVDALQLKDADLSFPLLLLLIAVLPGICEEFAFRGLMLSGYLNGMKAKWAIVITAIWFAAAHFSIYNLIPLIVMGLVLCYAAWRTQSIWVGVIIHILNNGLAVGFARYGEELMAGTAFSERTFESPILLISALFISGAGLLLIHKGARAQLDAPTRHLV